ncbi:DUF1573 domain-containing protein [Bacteroides sp. 214]|uniref:DUF1573 domain-containing protein n=1 Tax=Bacteroides sp. 214 TaxID=2302935 RepID=UPI0013D4BF88|nr:DUF1573 domain-containing protein [Bacteroides sp. 214]NDW12556.1 DUF1573 domain-containing protein [Bacteroides sp. 214]
MKTINRILLSLTILIANNYYSIASDKPKLIIDEKTYNFGEVSKKETSKIVGEYYFTNESSFPIVIFKVDVFCGCLSVEYPKHPIMKGEKGVIKVTIDTKNQEGRLNKSVFIKSNAENDVVVIRIEGIINN